jgi:outer membrane lipoprotein SlyB
MAEINNDLVAGVFERRGQAEAAIADLWRAGFPRDRIDMATRSEGVTEATPAGQLQEDAAEGATTGAIAGASAGAIAGAVLASFIPGLGAVIGGGLLAGVIGGAALGAAGGTFLGPFLALKMARDDAHHLASQVDQGRTVVLVQTSDRQEEAHALLRRHGAVEVRGPHLLEITA